MRCSTCGEQLTGNETQCPTCGASVVDTVPGPGGLTRCPRCGYAGQGVSYFSKPAHLGILGGLALVSYGIGGLIYWLLRRESTVCPNCGMRWDWIQRRLPGGGGGALARIPSLQGDLAFSGPPVDQDLPRAGGIRRAFGVLAAILAIILITVGIGVAEGPPLVMGAVFGALGSLSFWSGNQALKARRKAVMAGMQRSVLRLANQGSGRLTVTEVAAQLNLSMEGAERILMEMDDGFRVRSEITEDGVIVYEFPEVLHRRRLEPGSQP